MFYHQLREAIFERLAAESEEPVFGEIEVGKSYFDGQRKGKRGRGAAGKVPAFGLLKRSRKVRVVIVPDTISKTLQEENLARQHCVHGQLQGL